MITFIGGVKGMNNEWFWTNGGVSGQAAGLSTGRDEMAGRPVPSRYFAGRDKPVVFKNMSRESVPFFKLCYSFFDETLHDGAIDTLMYLLSLLYERMCVRSNVFTRKEGAVA